MRALIVEDQAKMANLLCRGLREEGYAADVALTGERAITMANGAEYDVIVLDVMLPGIDGFEVCRRLREAGVRSPALMLTARDAVEDRAAGLDAGADDYLPKPFSFAELNARLRALSRRGPIEQAPVLEVGYLRVDPRSHRVWRGDVEIELSTKAFAVLETLMRRPGQVFSRFDLLEHAWDRSYENRSNIIDVYIKNLRAKIDRPFGIHSIETVRGAGYRLRADGGVPVTGQKGPRPRRRVRRRGLDR
jgi:two-component system OmpR family response regulator